ncbi:hypothetical protein J7K27_10710 [Candidatus Bathyarchaeota archaeon]|nr:hypothetical protein [Candidatus Bathyarchaeota archaeon]
MKYIVANFYDEWDNWLCTAVFEEDKDWVVNRIVNQLMRRTLYIEFEELDI